MKSLGSVSKRTSAIYERYYEEREAQRFANLFQIFDRLAAYVAASNLGAKLEIDYFSLAEIVRSYFLDAIRYKEYHFDPKLERNVELISAKLDEMGVASLDDIDPLSQEWTEIVHTTANINASKVAAYTAKWILRNKPISVISTDKDITAITSDKSSTRIGVPQFFLTNINEEFAYHCALVVLGIDATDVSPKKHDELIYCFRFRNFDESSYFMILSKDYLCEKERR